MQRSDFIELFEIMKGLPVTIRLLDPPLHEFLPKTDEEIAEVAGVIGVSVEKLTQRVDELHEFNPMLGHRGCRLAISYPEIAEMQARAIFEAAVEAAKSTGAPVVPEIMVPLVGLREELDFVKARIDAVAREVIGEAGVDITYLVGTMIELPRAAIRAHAIAEVAEFFSFGTNDLTQTTFGISRDDASSFLMTYQQKGIIEQDPFVTLDIDGVGELVRIASDKGRATRPDIKLGICGEHGGDPASVKFCETSVSTMSAARPSACRSPALPPRRRRSRKPALPDPGAKTDPKTGPKRRQICHGRFRFQYSGISEKNKPIMASGL
jgi:pyruvate,orthophosphate dikinase